MTSFESFKKQILDLLGELITEVNIKSKQPAKTSKGRKEQEKRFDELMKRADVQIFVAEEENRLLGVADLFILPLIRRGYYQGYLEDLVVTAGMRGKGIGSKLLSAIKTYCKDHNISVMKLNSGVYFPEAHRCYEKHGGVFTEKLFRFDL
ncbi:hypothetical protein A2966_01280 [Candidatus Roizmanbacteria bacterium RIFCSPLOWO2_01_FULL_41_22]|uniref:N-acetyltransferase domain-containing protein n=2 Tax=Candidatus Roizmaniibacteriota TaxID=1752723 RepID=A0A1F7JQL4_9BACT|nr:MAG: hypothetical protein A2966_01280 [Candidatus Roizmanbacteria bacterium RIFCSPLOWO2_01_FULL_41_22]OGK57909.1 MAG: hypothetical protein A3H86_03715 [Candidatus Roizmanbacteria bacterium RIFCSPLOWO2_02_FULL_41_9]